MPPEDRHSGTPGGGGGADVKSGELTNVADGGSAVVTFGTAFAATPRVVVAFAKNLGAVDILRVHGVTATGFTVEIHKGHGGQAHNWILNWIATDAGDP